MSKIKNITGNETSTAVVIEDNSRFNVFFDATGAVKVIVPMRGSFDRTPSKPIIVEDEVNIMDFVRAAAPSINMKESFEKALGREVEYLGFCSAKCEYPWNIEPNAARCGHCGDPILGAMDFETLISGSHVIGGEPYAWDRMARLLELALDGKINIYLDRSSAGEAYKVAIGWENPYMFKNGGATTFRGDVNYDYLRTYPVDWWPEAYSASNRGVLSKICGMDILNGSTGFINFVDDHGEALVKDPKTSLNPEREAQLREGYIHDRFINGFFYTQSGEKLRPIDRFISRLYRGFNETPKEIAKESGWEVYVQAIRKAGAKTIVHKDGSISWRFEAAVEAALKDPAWLPDFLTERYDADEDVISMLRIKDGDDDVAE